MSGLTNIGWLLIGAALGWLVGMLIDWFWWRNRRVCTDDEIRLRGEVDDLTTRNVKMKGQLSEFETERADWNTRIAALDGEIEGYKGEIGRYTTENSNLQTQLGSLESDNAGYIGRIGEFEQGNANLTARIGELEAQLANLEGEKLGFQTRLGEFESNNLALASSLRGLESEKVGLQGTIDGFETERVSMSSHIADLEAERADLQDKLGDLEVQNADLNAQVGSLETQNADLNVTLGNLESEKASLQGQIDDNAANHDWWETKFNALESENQSLRANIGAYEAEIEELKLQQAPDDNANSGLMMAGLGAAAAGAVGLAAMGDDDVEVEADAALDVESVDADVVAAMDVDTLEVDGALDIEMVDADAVDGLDVDIMGVGAADGAVDVDVVAVDAGESAEFASNTIIHDDLQMIWGIDPVSEAVLNNNGIYTYADLCHADPDGLATILSESDLNPALLSEETWPEQACLAADGKWDELSTLQATLKVANGDDLERLFGLGPKSEQILYATGIYSYAQLCDTTPEQLATILDAAGVNADLMNEETWPQQACLAADGDMQRLAILQAELKASQADDFSKIYGLGPKSIEVLFNNGIYKYSQLAKTDPDKIALMLTAAGVNADLMNEEVWPQQAALLARGRVDELTELQSTMKRVPQTETVVPDDLSVVWGIGPASEAVLNENGIYTYRALADANADDLTAMLDVADGNFSLVREETWPTQAQMLLDKDVAGFEATHETLSAEYVTRTIDVSAYTGAKDDLTRIWGIGPAVQKILNSKGIFTFEALAGTQLTMLQGIIAAAGDRFNLVKPELWIPQAERLAVGDDEGFESLRQRISAANR